MKPEILKIILPCIFCFLIRLNVSGQIQTGRRYYHTGGIQHAYTDKLKIKSSKFKLVHKTSQFPKSVYEGTWKRNGDTLTLNYQLQKEGSFKKKIEKVNREEKFIIGSKILRAMLADTTKPAINYFYTSKKAAALKD
jgi:hypothetical protein